MPETWIVNASPVIALAAIGREHLLTDLASKVLFPKAVELEVLAGPTNDSARKLFES